MHDLPELYRQPDLAARIALLVPSYRRLLGHALPGCADDMSEDGVAALWQANLPIVAHDTQADPRFFFANRAALAAFETTLDAFIGMPSRLSAEAPRREERQGLLDRVTKHGFIADYRGIRISAKGRRFVIADGVVWNLTDAGGTYQGQAAIFRPETDAS